MIETQVYHFFIAVDHPWHYYGYQLSISINHTPNPPPYQKQCIWNPTLIKPYCITGFKVSKGGKASKWGINNSEQKQGKSPQTDNVYHKA